MTDHRLTAITPENILSWGPCEDYTESCIRAIYGARPSLSPAEVLDLDIPVPDRLWAVLRPEVLGYHDLRLAVCDIAARTLPLYEAQYSGDDRPRHAIETARRYAIGEATAEELDAARGGAWAAAEVAWAAAAWSAWHVAVAAADAAEVAVWEAAVAVAGHARTARAAAWAAEGEAQIAIVRGYIVQETTDE